MLGNKLIPWVILYTFFLIAIFVANFIGFNFSSDIAQWGSVGDYFGGLLNPVFAFLSFVALLITIQHQSKQLRQTTRQLKQNETALKDTKIAIEQNEQALAQNAEALMLNNKELANSTEQLGLARQAHQEMEKTQKIQQFENLFSSMLNQLHIILGEIPESFYQDYVGQRLNSTKLENRKKILQASEELMKSFIYLYQVLKFIDLAEISFERKKNYSNVVRAYCKSKFLRLLMLNCANNKNQESGKYVKLLEKYSFFEHMIIFDDGVLNYEVVALIGYYPSGVLGNNTDYSYLIECQHCRWVVSKQRYLDIINFFKELMHRTFKKFKWKVVVIGDMKFQLFVNNSLSTMELRNISETSNYKFLMKNVSLSKFDVNVIQFKFENELGDLYFQFSKGGVYHIQFDFNSLNNPFLNVSNRLINFV